MALILLPAALSAQQSAPAERDPLMMMNRALYHYGASEYQPCLDLLSVILNQDPAQAQARFLRALCHGQLAVQREDEARLQRRMDATDKLAAIETQAAQHYQAMRADLDQLLTGRLTDQAAVLNLLNGVVRTKLAGYAGAADADQRGRLLAEAEEALNWYLNPPAASGVGPPAGLSRVRGEYFRAVVVYRQALRPAAKAGEPDELSDLPTLERAGSLMLALVDPQSDHSVDKLLPADTPDREREVAVWSSYASLYLGLIRTRQANDAIGRRRGDSARSFREQAQRFFADAERLDAHQGRSLSRGVIPLVTQEQIKALEETRTVAAAPMEDLTIEWRSGFAYDSNVTLLGDNTYQSSRIGREADVRFDTGVALSYTLDLAKVDESLDRWTLGVVGRSSASWHADIDSYNEQDYGASVALQYRLLDAWPGEGSVEHGPLYAAIQYDYDYFLLGNDGFLKSNRVSPRLTLYTFNQRVESTLAFSYEDRNYLEPLLSTAFDRDGNYFELSQMNAVDWVDMSAVYEGWNWRAWGLAHDPAPGDSDYQRWLRPYFGVAYSWDATRGVEYDTDRWGLRAGIEVPLPYGVTFDFSGEWEWENYKGERGGSLVDYHRRGREDFIQTYSFGLQRRFVLVPGLPDNRSTLTIDRLVMTLRGDVRFTDDDSNVVDKSGQAVFSYERAIFGLSVAFQFN